MKLLNKICDYLFDVHGRVVFIAGIAVLTVWILLTIF